MALLELNPESPAKLAPTPVGKVPAFIFEGVSRLALASTASPLPFVVAVPTAPPFNVKLISFPLTGELSEVFCRCAVIEPVDPP